jgi:hypothetical protein
MPYAAARRRLSASAIGTLPVSQSRISPVVGDCVVELVGLEPTTRVLWNMGVSDQLTRSDTRPRARRGPLLMGIFTKGNLGLPSRGMGSPGVPRTTAAFFPPDGTTTGRFRSC